MQIWDPAVPARSRGKLGYSSSKVGGRGRVRERAEGFMMGTGWGVGGGGNLRGSHGPLTSFPPSYRDPL